MVLHLLNGSGKKPVNIRWKGHFNDGKKIVLLVFFYSTLIITAFAQGNTIKGTVINEAQTPLTGVTIEAGVSPVKYYITDAGGNFEINNINKWPLKLTLSYAGYETQEAVVYNNTTTLNYVMRPAGNLQEVVVIGYGKSTKEKITGSVSKISGKTITDQPIVNPILALQGRAPGVFITTSSGDLAANVNVTIRGKNTVASGTHPLYIIDGVPMPSTGINAANYGGAAGTNSPFININSADIESIEILKDADATAIYGTRGANGVILITTKKAKAGPLRFNANVYKGVQSAVNKLELLNTGEYVAMRKEALANAGITDINATNAFDIVEWGATNYTDLQELIFGKNAAITDAQADIQAGNEFTQFLFSAGYRDENGVLMGKNQQQKATARLQVNHRSVNNKFAVHLGLTYSTMHMESIGTSGFSYAWLAPNIPLVDETTGKPYFRGTATNTQSPMRYTYSDTRLRNFNFIGSTTFSYKILDNLTAKLDAHFTRLDYRGNERYKNNYMNPYDNLDYKNFAVFGNDYQYTYNIEPQLNFSEYLGAGKITALAGTTWQETETGGQAVTGQDFPSEALMDNLASAGRIPTNGTSTSFSQYRFNSVFGRINYDLHNRYILSATFRRDGSSRFGENKKFGNFWSLGAGWILSKEDFFNSLTNIVSFAKIRTSYGLTGNDQVANYLYMETFAATTVPYNGEPGLYANRLGNPEFGWETNKKYEAALELNFLKNRINTTTAFFTNLSDNQLVNYPISSQTGWSSYVANLDASIRNRGLEFEVTSLNFSRKYFQWRTTFNITTFKNKLLEFAKLKESAYANTYEVGKSINVFRKFEFLGIDPQNGHPIVKDQNEDGRITVSDYISYGSSDASFYGGLGNTFSYKGFELDVFFQFVKRPYANGFINSSNASQPGIIYNIPKFLLEGRWQKPGDDAQRPMLSSANSGAFATAYNYYRLSTAGVEDASYIRLKNLSFSYTLPAVITNKLGLTSIKVFMLGQNLLTITKYNGFDPETPGTVTPPMRIYTFGINASL